MYLGHSGVLMLLIWSGKVGLPEDLHMKGDFGSQGVRRSSDADFAKEFERDDLISLTKMVTSTTDSPFLAEFYSFGLSLCKDGGGAGGRLLEVAMEIAPAVVA